MNWMDQTEEAYKNGYAAGKKDAIKAIRSVPPGNREKVIAGLRCCINRECGGKTLCPYMGQCGEDIPVVMRDALSLLKEQEPRVLTKNEVECDCPDCVYFETRTGWWELAIKDEGESDRYFGVFVYGCNEWFMRGYEEYGKTWRCWTSRPSPEQMRDTLWEVSEQ